MESKGKLNWQEKQANDVFKDKRTRCGYEKRESAWRMGQVLRPFHSSRSRTQPHAAARVKFAVNQ